MGAVRATAVWRGGFRSDLTNGRGHTVVTDWPPDDGGGDAGASSLELCAMSLAGCVVTIFAAVARKRKIAFEAMAVDMTAERPEGAPTIERVRGHVTVRTNAPRAAVETALRLTTKTCPVGALFDKAGVASEWELTVEPAARASP